MKTILFKKLFFSITKYDLLLKLTELIIMKIKDILVRAIILLSILISVIFSYQVAAYSIPTKWEDAKINMSDLLNNGWQLIAHSSNRVATSASPGVSSYEEIMFTFILSKNNKYAMCFVENPKPPIANAASCRKLN
jgi:hypothetical protein